MSEETMTETQATPESTQPTAAAQPAATVQQEQPTANAPARSVGADYSFTGFENAEGPVKERLADFDKSFVPLAQKVGLTNEQADELRKTIIQSEFEEQAAVLKDSEAELRKEWGGAYQGNIDRINQALKMFDPDGTFNAFGLSSGLFAHAPFVRFMHSIAQAVTEETALKGINGGNAIGKEAIQSQLNAVYSDEAYKNAAHPRHAEAVRRANMLNAKLV